MRKTEEQKATALLASQAAAAVALVASNAAEAVIKVTAAAAAEQASLTEKVNKLAINIEKIATITEATHHRLFGNGQPGELQDIRDRIVPLENSREKASGAMWVLGIGCGLITGIVGLLETLHINGFFKH